MATKSKAEFLEAASKSRLLHEAQGDYAKSSMLFQDQQFESEQQLIRCLQSVHRVITDLVKAVPATAGLQGETADISKGDWVIPLISAESHLDAADKIFEDCPVLRERFGVIASDARRVIGFLCGCHGIPAEGDDTVE